MEGCRVIFENEHRHGGTGVIQLRESKGKTTGARVNRHPANRAQAVCNIEGRVEGTRAGPRANRAAGDGDRNREIRDQSGGNIGRFGLNKIEVMGHGLSGMGSRRCSRAAKSEFGKGGGFKGEGLGEEVGRCGLGNRGLVGSDKGIGLRVLAIEGVTVTHHAGGAVDNSEVVAEKFLGQATNDMEGPFVIENFLEHNYNRITNRRRRPKGSDGFVP